MKPPHVTSRLSPVVLIALSLVFAAPAQTKPAPKQHTPAKANASPTTLKPAPAPDVTVRDETFHSASLARDINYRIILPTDYNTSPRHYAVLYLLHGAMGSYVDWETKSRVAETVRGVPLIVVMPEGAEAWYTNSVTNPQDKYEDYIAKDLVQDVEGKYRAIRAQYARAIAGLSMGGYGATKFALKYPQQYAFAGAFSSAYHIPGDIDDPATAHSQYHDEWMRIYGSAGNPTRASNDVFELAKKVDPKVVPYLWISCGAADQLLDANRNFVHLLNERGIAYEYHEAPGGHTWLFWDDSLRAMLPVMVERMKLR